MPLLVSGERSIQWLRESDAFQVFETKNNNQQPFLIHLDCETNIPTAEESLHSFPLQDGTRCHFGRTGRQYLFEMEKSQGSMHLFFENEHCVHATTPSSFFQLSFGLWMAFNWFASFQKSICIHASCIQHQEQGILFIGSSGAGKSTQSRLWTQYFPKTTLLNDDGPILAQIDCNYHVFGSPWSGKTPCYLNKHYPVKALVKVIQSTENKIEKLSIPAAVATLLSAFPPAFGRNEQLSGNLLCIADGLLRKTPVYQLNCRPDEEAVLLTHHQIFHQP